MTCANLIVRAEDHLRISFVVWQTKNKEKNDAEEKLSNERTEVCWYLISVLLDASYSLIQGHKLSECCMLIMLVILFYDKIFVIDHEMTKLS